MKTLLFASLALAALALPASAQDQHKLMYVTPAEAAKLTARLVDHAGTHFLVRKDAYGQELVYRDASGVPEVHANWADRAGGIGLSAGTADPQRLHLPAGAGTGGRRDRPVRGADGRRR